jgi:predicted nucleic acid-binding Zn ribbon protein
VRQFRFLEPIGDEVRRELRRFGPSGAMAEIVRAWPAAVGESIARNAWPARVSRDGTLHVSTSSATWAFELGLLAADIQGRLAKALGEDAPAALRFAPGRLPEASAERDEPLRARRPRPTSEDRQEAARLAATIEDEKLRKVVAKAAAASLAKAASRPPGLLD